MSTDSIIAAALALEPETKVKLAEQLLESLDPPDQVEIDAAWAQEAERRIEALECGEERTVPADHALRQSRERLR
jgi:putative addiction module component (TIGR02574 family)